MSISTRIRMIASDLDINLKQLSRRIKINYSTVNNYVHGRMPNGEFLIALNTHLAININWVLTGQGNMYLAEQGEYTLKEPPPSYKNQCETQPNPRASRLCTYIHYKMNHLETDDQAWFERDFARTHKDYDDYFKEQPEEDG